jgi:hypothetical protein
MLHLIQLREQSITRISFFKGFCPLNEEILKPDELIKHNSKYKNKIETRMNLQDYLSEFIKQVNALPYVDTVYTDESPDSIKKSLSNYVFIVFNHPKDATDEEIKKVYTYGIRFSDHEDKYIDDSGRDRDGIKRNTVDVIGKMPKNLHKAGMKLLKQNLSSIQSEISEHENEKYGKQITHLTDTTKEESLKLRIREKLENIANGIYATDSATDVANWLVNKPKAYRILYDSKRDVYGIADALKATHMDIARHLYRTGYVYLTDEEIEKMRVDLGGNARYMTAQDLYAKYGFYGDNTMYGLFFIPKEEEYLDYEEQGFYNAETVMENGSMFTRKKNYFSSEGPIRDLYNKLLRMGQINESVKKPIEKIYKECQALYANDLNYMFNQIAMENGYTKDEINDFLRTLPEYSLSEMFEKYFKMYGLKRAQDMLRLRAARVGYTKKDIEQFLSDMFDD